MNELTLAIDIGITTTKAAWCNADGIIHLLNFDGKPYLPSVFYLPKNGDILVGQAAQDKYKVDPLGVVTELKCAIERNATIRVSEDRQTDSHSLLVALFQTIKQQLDVSPKRVILTVSHRMKIMEDKLEQAAIAVGWSENEDMLAFEPESFAAAHHWFCGDGYSEEVETRVVIFDCGGGTIDLACVQRTGKKINHAAEPGTVNISGLDEKALLNKVLPFFESFLKPIVEQYPEVQVLLVGGNASVMLEKAVREIHPHVFRSQDRVSAVVRGALSYQQKSSKGNTMSSTFEHLKQIFADKPEVLKLLDIKSFNDNVIEGSLAADAHRQEGECFSKPVNMYTTGRTGAGKTTLGNRFLEPEKNPMKSTGRINCTDRVGVFKLSSNLRYFDLPGAGAREHYENINRAALLMPQIEDRRAKMFKIESFLLSDYTDFATNEQSKNKEFTIEEWQIQQESYTPDICLYVIAPHMGFTRDDEKYLFELLETLKERKDGQNIILFGLNLHHRDSVRLPTNENIQDVKKIVKEIHQEVFGTETKIIEINSLTGEGVNLLTKEICEILPVEKLGKMRNILDSKLKDTAKAIRSRRYREALIHVASRLATRRVDESFGDQELLSTVLYAICLYGVSIFKDDSDADFELCINELSETIKEYCKLVISVKEPVFGTRELTTTRETPEYGNITEEHDVTLETLEWVDKERSNKFTIWLLGTHKRVLEKKEVTKTIKHTRLGVTGTKIEEVSLGEVTVVNGYTDRVISVEHKKGGYFVIEKLLSLGIGIENASFSSSNFDIDAILEVGSGIIEKSLFPNKSKIEDIIEKIRKSDKAEEEITKIMIDSLLI